VFVRFLVGQFVKWTAIDNRCTSTPDDTPVQFNGRETMTALLSNCLADANSSSKEASFLNFLIQTTIFEAVQEFVTQRGISWRGEAEKTLASFPFVTCKIFITSTNTVNKLLQLVFVSIFLYS